MFRQPVRLAIVRRFLARLIGCVMVCVQPGLLLAQNAQNAQNSAEPVGVVLQVSGSATVARAGETDTEPNRLDLLYAGDTWQTASSGRLAVRLKDNTLLRFDADTALRIDAGREALALTLLAGGVQSARKRSAGESQLAMMGSELSGEARRVPDAPASYVLGNTGQLMALPGADAEAMEALAALPPARWRWLAPGNRVGRASAATSVLAEQSLVVRYRERTKLNVPVWPGERRQKRSPRPVSGAPEALAPMPRDRSAGSVPRPRPEPERQPEPALSDEARYQQKLETTLLQMSALLRAGKGEEAFGLAERRRRDFAGEPDFDLLYGRAALNRGAYQRSSFALERALINYPTQPTVRLTLVEAYLGMGNTGAAERQLERARENQLTDRQARRWKSLDEIRRQLQLRNRIMHSYSISAQGFYSTNLNQGLACSVCELTDSSRYEPDQASRARGGGGTSVQARYDRVVPLSQRRRRTMALGLNGRITTLASANSVGGLLSVGNEWSSGRRINGQLLPGWSPGRLSLTAVTNAGVDDIWATRDLVGSISLIVDDQPSQSMLVSSGLGDDWSWAASDGELGGRWQIGGRLNIADEPSQHYFGATASVSPTWTPPGRWVYQSVLFYQWQQYVNNETFENELQRNHQFRLNATALRPLTENTQLSFNAGWRQIVSNQPLAEYRAFEIGMGVQHRW